MASHVQVDRARHECGGTSDRQGILQLINRIFKHAEQSIPARLPEGAECEEKVINLRYIASLSPCGHAVAPFSLLQCLDVYT